jgi:hypothetical protein
MPTSERPWEISWEKWESAKVPTERLDRIAVVTNARNPSALRRKTFPAYPMDAALMLTAVVFEHHKQRLKFDEKPTLKQIKQIKRVAEITGELERTIKLLDEPTRFRLRNVYKGLALPLPEIRSLFDAAQTAAIPIEKKESNRPSRSFKHRSLDLLIHGLYRLIVVDARGELTLWEDRVSGLLKGTLPAVLELLRPNLHNILPEKIPFSTLHRALARARKAYAS